MSDSSNQFKSTEYLHDLQEHKGGVSFNISKTGLLISEKKDNDNQLKPGEAKHILWQPLEENDNESISVSEEEIVKIDYDLFGSWGTYGFDYKLWLDERRPVVKIKNYEDLELNDDEKSGYLTDRIITVCSSYLEKCPGTCKYALCKCILKNKYISVQYWGVSQLVEKINDISILYYHHFLQYIDLSFNNLQDISALSGLPYLMYLDVSHNKLRTVLDFKPPINLTFVDYSYNLIDKITDLSSFWSMKVLNLSHNYIEVITGLEQLRYLETLNLSYNRIKRLQNLNYMRIIYLNVQNNKIQSFEIGDAVGLKTMSYLSYVRLAHNNLKSLKLFEGAVFIQSIDVEANKIADIIEISYLKDLRLLVHLNLNKNAVQKFENYELVCLNTVKNLNILDGLPVHVSQKILAKDTLTPSIEQRARKDHANLLIVSHFGERAGDVGQYTPVDEAPRPLMVMVAPQGSKQELLIKQFAGANREQVIRLISHTTRERVVADTNDDYYFVSQQDFIKLVKCGEFVMVYELFGNLYGLTRRELARGSAEKGKVMITHADLQAALTLRLGGHRPWLVLAMPRSRETHKNWLTEIYRTCILNPSYPEGAIIACNKQTLENDTSRYISIYTTYSCEKITTESYFYNYFKHITESFMLSGKCNFYVEMLNEKSGLNYHELNEYFYNKILEKRDEYVEYHNKNPSVFYETIFTDEYEAAMVKLKNLVTKILDVQKYAEPLNKTEANEKSQQILKNQMKMFCKGMERGEKVSVPCENKERANSQYL